MGSCNGKNQLVYQIKKTDNAGKSVKQQYNVYRTPIGKGAFAKVYEGHWIDNPEFKVAIKCINKGEMGKEDLKAIGDEVQSLAALDHPNIMKYYDSYEDRKYLFIVTEFCNGSTLGHQLKWIKRFTEKETAHIIHQLVSAIHHCHINKVSHRDIKPDNVMIDDKMNAKLIDFGLSKLTSKNRFKSIIGTPLYMAPEMFEGKYTNKCDIWSLGVLIYHMISGEMPYKGTTFEEVKTNVNKYKPSFISKVWDSVSDSWIELIKSMMVCYTKRLTAAEVLKSKWFDILKEPDWEQETQASTKNILESFLHFNAESELKKVPIQMLNKVVEENDLSELNHQFELIDKNKDGVISLSELKQALKNAGFEYTDYEIKQMMKKWKLANKDSINYSEFLMITIDKSNLKKETMVDSLINNYKTKQAGSGRKL